MPPAYFASFSFSPVFSAAIDFRCRRHTPIAPPRHYAAISPLMLHELLRLTDTATPPYLFFARRRMIFAAADILPPLFQLMMPLLPAWLMPAISLAEPLLPPPPLAAIADYCAALHARDAFIFASLTPPDIRHAFSCRYAIFTPFRLPRRHYFRHYATPPVHFSYFSPR